MKSFRKRRRNAAAAVELAVVLPIFFLIIFGIVEFGRAMMAQQILINTAREGARACAVSSITAADVERVCKDYAAACGIDDIDVTVDPDPTIVERGDPVAVSVSAGFTEVSWFSPFWAGDAVLGSTASMRKEREYSN